MDINKTCGLTLFTLLLMLSCSYGQSHSYKKVVDKPTFVRSYDERKNFNRIIKYASFVDATRYLPRGYSKNGSVDYTKYLQKAIDENNHVLMPNFPVLINDDGLELNNNSEILFSNKSELRLKPSDKGNYQVLRVHSKNNVHIYFPKITGDRYNHLNSSGEWGMGISIRSSSNVYVLNAAIKNCWGDGIYVGSDGSKKASQNIRIEHGNIDNNRRNGISIINVDSLVISNVVISNTNGTNPQVAIDFEPNNNKEVLKNIYLDNIYTFNNFNQGIFYCFNMLNGSKERVDITLVNHIDKGAKAAIGIMNSVPKQYDNYEPVSGVLRLLNVNGDGKNTNLRIFDKAHLGNFEILVQRGKEHPAFKTTGDVSGVALQ